MNSRHRKVHLFPGTFEQLPLDAAARLETLVDLTHSFRIALAEQLQPVVRMLLQEHPPSDDAGRRELAHRLNYVLRESGLAIRDPVSGQPSSIVPEPYRLVLQSRTAPSNRRTRSGNVKTLPPLELIEHTRQEPFLTWRQKTGKDSEDLRR